MTRVREFKQMLSYKKEILKLQNDYYYILHHIINNLKIDETYKKSLEIDYQKLKEKRERMFLRIIRR